MALEQIRATPGAGAQFGVVAALAGLLLWLALQGRLEGGPPPAHVSALLVCGLLALFAALLRLADLLGADFTGDFPAGAFTWTALVEAAAAAFASFRRGSAVAALVAAVAFGVAVLSGWAWLLDPEGVTPYRVLLLLMALGFAVASLPLRSVSRRHHEQMVNAAGLAILAIPASQGAGLLFGAGLPAFWEIVVLAGGLGLVGHAAADRAPGPAYLGAANLAAFVALAGLDSERTLEGWPLVLLLAGAGLLAFGLRPRAPLPPEPDGYHPDDLPLAARSRQDAVIRVHKD